MHPPVAIISFAALTLVAACGGAGSGPKTVSSAPSVPTAAQSSTSSAPAKTATPAAADLDLLQEFTDFYASRSDPEALRDLLKLTAPGSPAHAYVSHQANLSEASLDGGVPLVDYTPENIGDSELKACDNPADEKTCTTLGGFKVDASGKLVDLTVNGKQVSDRLTVGSGEQVSSAGNKFTFLTAYKSVQSNALFVAVKVESGSKPINLNLYSATYRSPDGKQRQATEAMGPLDLDAASNSVVTMVFQGVQLGGKVTLDGCVAECANQVKAVIKVG